MPEDRPSEGTHPEAPGLSRLLTLELWGRDSGRVRASLQLHMKDVSGTSLRPRGPVINNVGRRELGKSILEDTGLLKGLNLTDGLQGSWESE